MKKLFLINDTFENKISYYLLACFLVALPFDHFYSEWLLIIFCIHTLIHLKKNNLYALRNKKSGSLLHFFSLMQQPSLLAIIKRKDIKILFNNWEFYYSRFLFLSTILTLVNTNFSCWKYSG